jgi:sugar (pentulose or hexulose) kinase
VTDGVVVGIDLGTGSARAVAIDAEGRVLGTASAPYEGRGRWAVGHADPESWRAAVQSSLEQLAIAVPAAVAPAALAVGGQSPAVVSSDGLDALTVLHPAADGASPHSAHQQLWDVLRPEHPDAQPLQAWDWILFALGAPRQQGRWPGSPDMAGFGPVTVTGTPAGTASGEWGVAKGTLLVPGGADAYMAFWSAGVDTPGRGLDPGGRTGGIGVAAPAAAEAPTDYGLRSAVAGIDIVGGPTAAHGLAVEWWARMTGRTVEDLLEAAGSVPPGSGGVLALPYFEGERAPRWNRDLRAELVGMDSGTDRAQVMRALLEGCAYGLRHIVDSLAAEGTVLTELMVAGSPARSPLWCRIKADVLGVPVEIPAFPDLAAHGAALAAGAAVGWWPAPGVGKSGDWPIGERTIIQPHPSAVYDEGYARWVELGDAEVARVARWARSTEAPAP